MSAFKDPKNVGELKNANGIGKVGNPTCGDVMEVYVRIEKNEEGKEYIKDVKVKTFGCVAAIATSSTMTTMVKGKTLEEIEKMTNQDVADELSGLPPLKMHCSNLSVEALHDAIKNYESNKK